MTRPGETPMGLVDIPTDRLEHLLRAVYRGEAECPLTPLALACVRLQPQALTLLGHLRGLDQRGVQAVLVAVIAERRAQPVPVAPLAPGSGLR